MTRPGWRCAPYVRHAPQRLQMRGRTGRGSVAINTRSAGSGLGAPDATFEGRATSGLGVVSGLLVACRDCEGRLSFLCSLCSRSIPQAERCQHAAHHTVHRHGLILAGNKVTPVPAPSSSTRWGLTWLLQNHPRRRASNCLLILFWFGSSAAYLASTGVSRQRRLRITKTGYRCPLWMASAVLHRGAGPAHREEALQDRVGADDLHGQPFVQCSATPWRRTRRCNRWRSACVHGQYAATREQTRQEARDDELAQASPPISTTFCLERSRRAGFRAVQMDGAARVSRLTIGLRTPGWSGKVMGAYRARAGVDGQPGGGDAACGWQRRAVAGMGWQL